MKLKDVTAETFETEVIQSNQPVLIDFWGPQCAPCLALAPSLEELAEKNIDKIKVLKIDASKNRRLCLKLKVLGLPTFLIFQNGKEAGRISGGSLKVKNIEELINSTIEK